MGDDNAKLRASEERYRSVVAAMAEGVVLQDETGAIVECNAAAERLLGLSEAQMAGRSSLDPRWRAVHEHGAPFPGEMHPAMLTLRTGEPHSAVIMGVYKPDGTLTWLSINTQPLRAADGRVEGVVSTFADITPFKQAEAALRESEKRYRGIVESSSDGIWSITLDGRTLFANEQMARILRCTREDLLRSSLWDFVFDADRDRVLAQLEDRARGALEQHEFVFRRSDGGLAWTSVSASPMCLADGTPAALAMVRDITEARRVQRSLERTNERLERALVAARMWAWEVDAATDRVLWSQNHHAVLGLPADHRFERAPEILELVHPDDREQLLATVTGFGSSADARSSQEYRVVWRDGQVRWVQTRAEHHEDPTTGARTMLGTTTDITGLKQLEEQLVHSRKLEAIGRLAGGVAHDFNNVLTAILASVAVAERTATPAQELELHTIRTASERAAGLTRQLLAFARKQVVELRALDMNETVVRLEPVLRRVLGEKALLSTDLAPDLWATRADPVLLDQVLLNLVANARDALATRGGHVRIATRNEVRAYAVEDVPAGEYVLLAVEDDGPGMPADVQQHIFEPFFTTKAGGTGLGLASCYGSVKQLGGHISVDGGAGRGATLFVRLPRCDAQLASEPAPTHSGLHDALRTVLVVEDEELVRRYTVQGLRDLGYSVLCASSAEEALSIATEHVGTLDALITDLVLPRMDGAALARALHARRPQLRVLFLSGYPTDVLDDDGMPVVPDAQFLAKPYSLDELASQVSALFAPRRSPPA